MEQLKEMLFQLCSAAGTPGDEHFAALQAKKALEPYCTDVTIDHMGNVIGFMGDKNADASPIISPRESATTSSNHCKFKFVTS